MTITTDRRTMIAGGIAATTIGTAARTSVAETADPVRPLFKRWKELYDYLEDPADNDPGDIFFDKWIDVAHEICATRATTIQGVRDQLEYAALDRVDFGSPTPRDELLLRNMLASLAALSGEGAA